MRGSCACGQIHFETNAPLRDAGVCHCTQCRKMSGYAWASAEVPLDSVQITGPVKWVALSDIAKRGICPDCGSFLFWHGNNATLIEIALGAFDGPTGVQVETHIFTNEKGDYYSLPHGTAQIKERE